ncbi:MAG: PorT family protein [Chlorobi bacterium]|nr:PorT family protein [Chlorobiota bacterium]
MKTSLLILFMSFFAIISSAQTFFKIKTGINFSRPVYAYDFNNKLTEDYKKNKTGFCGGFVLHHFFNEILSVQAELLYSQKGLKIVQNPYGTTINTMNYIEMPVSGQYSLFKTKNTFLNIYIGGYTAYWISGAYKITDYYTGETVSTKVDFNNADYSYERIDAGISAGLSYRFNDNAELYLVYSHGMIESAKENVDGFLNRLFSFGINFIVLK